MQAGGPNESGSSIWSVDVSSSGERVVFGSGYPEMSIVCLHGKGKKEFEYTTGGIPGALHISRSKGEIIAGMVARRGLGNIICISSRGKQVWQITTHKKIENLDVTGEGDVVCGTKDGTILYLDRGGKVSWHRNMGLYKGPIATYFFKNEVMAVTNKGNAYLFDKIGNMLAEQDLGAFVNKIAVCQGGFIAASLGSSKDLYVLDEDAKVQFIKELEEPISAMNISSKGNFLLAGTMQGSVYLFSKTGRLLFSHMLANRVNCLAFSENEKYFAVGTNDFYVYFFNTKGELYWVYKTGAVADEAFSKQWPQGSMAIQPKGAEENRPAPNRQEAAPLDAFGRLLRRPEPEIFSKKGAKKGKSQKTQDLTQPSPAKTESEPKPPEGGGGGKKGVVIKHWTDFKDVTTPMYFIKIENHLDGPLETIEAIPRMSAHTFTVSPEFKDFETLQPNKTLTLRFRLAPAQDSAAFEDTRVSCDVNYIEPMNRRLVSVKPYDLLVPFTIPQIQLASPVERMGVEWGEFAGARIRRELPTSQEEISGLLSEFMSGHNIPFSRDEVGDKILFIVFGKDYRGKLLMVEIAIESYGKHAGKVVVDLRTQSDKLLPPLYYLVQNLLGEILRTGNTPQEDTGDEFEAMDEEGDVEWMEDGQSGAGDFQSIVRGAQGPGGAEVGGDVRGVSVLGLEAPQQQSSIGPSRLDPHSFYLMDYQDRRWLLKLLNGSMPVLKKCLLFSRVYPQKFREMYEYDPDAIDIRWISGMGQEGAYGPNDTKRFIDEASKFLKTNPKGLVVLDGLDYLLNSIDFSTAYGLVSDLRDLTALKDGALLVCLNLSALSDMELNQLKKEADGVILS